MTTQQSLPGDITALRALVLTAWAERDAERAEKTRLIEERDQLAGQNDRLRQLIRQLQRLQFGRRSEKLDPDQLSLALEDLEQAVAKAEAEQEKADPTLQRGGIAEALVERFVPLRGGGVAADQNRKLAHGHHPVGKRGIRSALLRAANHFV